MKMTKYMSIVALASSMVFTACQDDMEKFDNKVFDDAATPVSTLLMENKNNNTTRTLRVALAQPAPQEMVISYRVNPGLVETYNMIYGEKAVMLPSENYSMDKPEVVIPADGVTSSDLVVEFKDIMNLDRDVVYVLPVEIANSPIEVLESKRVSYFVVRGAALINVVANMNQNYAQLNNVSASELSSFDQITVEALLFPDEFGKLISTIMGIEGRSLLRIGDAGVPDNQLQFATSSGNVSDPAWQFETKKWTFMTFTYDKNSGEIKVYFNGVQKGATYTKKNVSINWNSSQFYIGKSYDDARFFNGNMSECRIWNRVLTQDEIMEPNHFYTVDPESEGLVAYWKMDEGNGMVFHDSANGYDLVCNSAPTWVPVELPAK
ncbi:DUF1735 and LamG domain-containing protein [Duncaniella freteri]|uniref:DUF1735 and LamG domain-containing protein n=2 Tax=Duncaniella TaxID=2518495 RepID=UPI00136F0C8A|nr:DUF1735 and LamG domain-containing protein [Duncaniella freteri]NBJ07762.1 DUF1735 domain-containing protein [Alistipes sp. Z76]NCE69805.1 DUF1735 domain-containing protein [Muribaculaceae bacterium M3]